MGPDEMLFGLPGHEVVNLKASYYYNKSFRFYLLLSNIMDSAYIARPDPDAVEEPGRNLMFGLSYSF
jgi:outer membrane receptor protein involved in Fe transport